MKKRLLATIPVLLVVFLCTFPVYAAGSNGSTSSFTGFHDMKDGDLIVSYTITAFNTYLVDVPGPASNRYQFEGLCKLEINNITNDNIVMIVNGTNQFQLFVTTKYPAFQSTTDIFKWTLIDAEFVGGHLIPSSVGTNGVVYLEPYTGDQYTDSNPNLVIPKNSKLTTYFILRFTATVPGSITSGSFDSTSIYVPTANYTYEIADDDIKLNDFNYLPDIYNKLVEILEHYNANAPQSQTVTNESSALETQSDAVHNQESSFYTQTNTALSNTGLSNFSFTPNVIGGLGKAKYQFTYVWNKLGDYKDVYLFSMTLAIALMIIRHVRPIRRKKEE